MARVLLRLLAAGATAALAAPASAAARAGDLDPSFGSAGKVLTSVGNSGDAGANAVGIDSSRRLLAAGVAHDHGADGFAVVRYVPGGRLDRSFGTGGRAFTVLGARRRASAFGIAPRSSGGAVAAGFADRTRTRSDVALTRYDASGRLDAGFGNDGSVLSTLGTGRDALALDVIVQDDGKVVIAGSATGSGSREQMLVARFNADGSADAGFGAGGVVVTSPDLGSFKGTSRLLDLAPARGGKLVATGFADTRHGSAIVVLRLNPDGSRDQSFGSNGEVVTSFGDRALSKATAAVVLPDGGVAVVGLADGSSPSNEFDVVRYKANGSIDRRFGSRGVARAAFEGGGEATPIGIARQPNGRLVVAGTVAEHQFNLAGVARLRAGGGLDKSFGKKGRVKVALGADLDDAVADVTIQRDGRIVVAGTASDRGFNRFALARLKGR